MPLTVGMLIELFKKINKNAVIVIGNDVVIGIEGPVNGRLREGVYNMKFVQNEKGRDMAVYFTKNIEDSDGEIYPFPC